MVNWPVRGSITSQVFGLAVGAREGSVPGIGTIVAPVAPAEAMPPEAVVSVPAGMPGLAAAMPLLVAGIRALAEDVPVCRIPMLEQPASKRTAVHAKSFFMFFSWR
jgi:hypothetical protein